MFTLDGCWNHHGPSLNAAHLALVKRGAACSVLQATPSPHTSDKMKLRKCFKCEKLVVNTTVIIQVT